jgi:DivIVA domain-containing protein
MKKFDKSLNGYNIHQVNAFVDDVVEKVDSMVTKMKQKDLEIAKISLGAVQPKKVTKEVEDESVTFDFDF